MSRCNRAFFSRKNFFEICTIVTFVLPIFALANEDKAAQLSFRATGFVSLVGGKVVSGDLDAQYVGPDVIDNHTCPCYIADWANAGVYTDSFSLAQESHAGVQASYQFTQDFSVSGQLVVRGTDSHPNIQWAYASYKFTSEWELQAGRKRIPLYFYSDFQDIGVSYPWVTPPPELYGWEATNYNGASLRYNTSVGEINISSSGFLGNEKVKDSAYQKLYYESSNQVDWNHIRGVDLELNYNFLTARFVYMKTQVKTNIKDQTLLSTADLDAYGAAINLDFDKIFVLSEFTQLTRHFIEDQYSYRAPALTLGVGLRLGDWTPFLNYARYTEHSSDLQLYQPQSFHRTSFTLRYDLNSRSDIKIQFDKNLDATHNFGGNASVFRISYDRVFE